MNECSRMDPLSLVRAIDKAQCCAPGLKGLHTSAGRVCVPPGTDFWESGQAEQTSGYVVDAQNEQPFTLFRLPPSGVLPDGSTYDTNEWSQGGGAPQYNAACQAFGLRGVASGSSSSYWESCQSNTLLDGTTMSNCMPLSSTNWGSSSDFDDAIFNRVNDCNGCSPKARQDWATSSRGFIVNSYQGFPNIWNYPWDSSNFQSFPSNILHPVCGLPVEELLCQPVTTNAGSFCLPFGTDIWESEPNGYSTTEASRPDGSTDPSSYFTLFRLPATAYLPDGKTMPDDKKFYRAGYDWPSSGAAEYNTVCQAFGLRGVASGYDTSYYQSCM